MLFSRDERYLLSSYCYIDVVFGNLLITDIKDLSWVSSRDTKAESIRQYSMEPPHQLCLLLGSLNSYRIEANRFFTKLESIQNLIRHFTITDRFNSFGFETHEQRFRLHIRPWNCLSSRVLLQDIQLSEFVLKLRLTTLSQSWINARPIPFLRYLLDVARYAKYQDLCVVVPSGSVAISDARSLGTT